MRIKILETQSGQRYIVSEKNELAQYRYDFSKGGLQRPQFSGNWKLVGFAQVLPFGHIGPDIPPEKVLGQDLKFKNGRGAYMVLDYDYGTHRIWGDRAVAFYETEVRFQ